MLNTPGKEMDLLRVTVKVPGKRPPRAVPACPAGLNGRAKDMLGPEGKGSCLYTYRRNKENFRCLHKQMHVVHLNLSF